MWLYRIISSFLGIRKKEQLSDDLNNISFGKVIFLFISINVVFIGLVLISFMACPPIHYGLVGYDFEDRALKTLSPRSKSTARASW